MNKIEKKQLKSVFWRSFALQGAFNYERMQNVGYMYAIMKALVDVGFTGVIRPDHGRTIWGEVAMPGYGLYDRALGISYLQGLHEAVVKSQMSAEIDQKAGE